MTSTKLAHFYVPNPTASDGAPYLGFVWALLIVNTLGSGGADSIISIPPVIYQVITMGALTLAVILLILLNPRLQVLPSVYLLLLSLLLISSIAASIRMESGFGALLRCARLATFLFALWLITRWSADALLIVRRHVRVLAGVLLTVLAGLLVAPSVALPDSYGGRLVSALWYMPPPQVAQYAAVVVGLAVIMWLTQVTPASSVVWLATPATAILILTHTRTALAGLLVGVGVAVLTLTLTNDRARRAVAIATAFAVLAVAAFGSVLLDWLRRGQGEDALESLTGRQKVWDQILAAERSVTDQVLGVGLTDKSFGGLPIDSTWLAVYHEQGLLGVALAAAIFLFLIFSATMRPPSPKRACAIFLIVYCLVSSYTEVGVGDASSYMLYLALASMLLNPNYQHTHMEER